MNVVKTTGRLSELFSELLEKVFCLEHATAMGKVITKVATWRKIRLLKIVAEKMLIIFNTVRTVIKRKELSGKVLLKLPHGDVYSVQSSNALRPKHLSIYGAIGKGGHKQHIFL